MPGFFVLPCHDKFLVDHIVDAPPFPLVAKLSSFDGAALKLQRGKIFLPECRGGNRVVDFVFCVLELWFVCIFLNLIEHNDCAWQCLPRSIAAERRFIRRAVFWSQIGHSVSTIYLGAPEE